MKKYLFFLLLSIILLLSLTIQLKIYAGSVQIVDRNSSTSSSVPSLAVLLPAFIKELDMPIGIYRRTKEHGQNISKSTKGRIKSKKECENISKALKARYEKKSFTQEHKYNLSIGQLKRKKRDGYINSPEARKKQSKKMKGKKFTKKLCNRVSKNKKGKKRKKLTQEHKDNVSKALTGKKFTKKHCNNIRISVINRLNKLKGQISPSYNKKACIFFNKLNKKYKLKGKHAENGGEFHIKGLGYFVDFYSKKYNLVIEWNEERHYDNNKLSKKHLKRQNEIKKYLKCKFINIRQNTFKQKSIFKRIEKQI